MADEGASDASSDSSNTFWDLATCAAAVVQGRDGGLEWGEQSFLKLIAPANRNLCGIETIRVAKTSPL